MEKNPFPRDCYFMALEEVGKYLEGTSSELRKIKAGNIIYFMKMENGFFRTQMAFEVDEKGSGTKRLY